MTSMTKKRWLIATASIGLVVGLVVLALTLGGDPDAGPSLASDAEATSDDGSLDSGRRRTDDERSSDRGGDNVPDQDGGDASAGDDTSSNTSGSSGGSGSTGSTGEPPDQGGDVDRVLDGIDDVVDGVTGPITEILCTDDERAAIEAKVDELLDAILAEADEAKDDLLDSLGLGGLLGGITNAIQQQLDAIDAEAHTQIAKVKDLAEDALVICEEGGDPLSVF